eukprot:PhM_4_TR18792/c1_g3_i1/m.77442
MLLNFCSSGALGHDVASGLGPLLLDSLFNDLLTFLITFLGGIRASLLSLSDASLFCLDFVTALLLCLFEQLELFGVAQEIAPVLLYKVSRTLNHDLLLTPHSHCDLNLTFDASTLLFNDLAIHAAACVPPTEVTLQTGRTPVVCRAHTFHLFLSTTLFFLTRNPLCLLLRPSFRFDALTFQPFLFLTLTLLGEQTRAVDLHPQTERLDASFQATTEALESERPLQHGVHTSALENRIGLTLHKDTRVAHLGLRLVADARGRKDGPDNIGVRTLVGRNDLVASKELLVWNANRISGLTHLDGAEYTRRLQLIHGGWAVEHQRLLCRMWLDATDPVRVRGIDNVHEHADLLLKESTDSLLFGVLGRSGEQRRDKGVR